MSNYYIIETDNELAEEYLKNTMKLKFLSSDISGNPEGYLFCTEATEIVDLIRELDCVTIHDIPESIMEQYESVDDFVTDYWDGNILLNQGIVIRE